MTAESPPTQRPRRPVLLWLILIYYGLSGAWTTLSFLLIRSGAIPLSDAQRRYFSELGPLDLAQTLGSALLLLAFAVQLFRLRASAIPILIAALIFNVTATAWHALTTNWLEAIGAPGLIGTGIAWAVMLAVLVYCRRLRSREVLG